MSPTGFWITDLMNHQERIESEKLMMLLPKSCAVFCACAASYLKEAGLPTRTIEFEYKDGAFRERHVVTFFQFDERVRGYDQNGTYTLPKRVKLESKPLLLAKEWLKQYDGLKVKSARFY